MRKDGLRFRVVMLTGTLCLMLGAGLGNSKNVFAEGESNDKGITREYIDASDDILQAGGLLKENELYNEAPALKKSPSQKSINEYSQDGDSLNQYFLDRFNQGANATDDLNTKRTAFYKAFDTALKNSSSQDIMLTVKLVGLQITRDECKQMVADYLNNNPDVFYLKAQYSIGSSGGYVSYIYMNYAFAPDVCSQMISEYKNVVKM